VVIIAIVDIYIASSAFHRGPTNATKATKGCVDLLIVIDMVGANDWVARFWGRIKSSLPVLNSIYVRREWNPKWPSYSLIPNQSIARIVEPLRQVEDSTPSPAESHRDDVVYVVSVNSEARRIIGPPAARVRPDFGYLIILSKYMYVISFFVKPASQAENPMSPPGPLPSVQSWELSEAANYDDRSLKAIERQAVGLAHHLSVGIPRLESQHRIHRLLLIPYPFHPQGRRSPLPKIDLHLINIIIKQTVPGFRRPRPDLQHTGTPFQVIVDSRRWLLHAELQVYPHQVILTRHPVVVPMISHPIILIVIAIEANPIPGLLLLSGL
jgi:hypothetical protein